MSKQVHVAIVRKIKPGCEAEFQAVLREFFQQSLGHPGILGASMLVPPPGSGSREYGILRSFANGEERDLFYASPFFAEWEERVGPLTEGTPVHRELTGLEAWFRDTRSSPPKWKMVLLTWIAVWPVSMAVPVMLRPVIGGMVPAAIFAGVAALGIVLVLTWLAMPALIFLTKKWLYPSKPQLKKEHQS